MFPARRHTPDPATNSSAGVVAPSRFRCSAYHHNVLSSANSHRAINPQSQLFHAVGCSGTRPPTCEPVNLGAATWSRSLNRLQPAMRPRSVFGQRAEAASRHNHSLIVLIMDGWHLIDENAKTRSGCGDGDGNGDGGGCLPQHNATQRPRRDQAHLIAIVPCHRPREESGR